MFSPKIRFFFFIVLTTSLGQMAAEIYVPSLSYISSYFHTGHDLVQISISCFLLGMAIPAIFYGYFSDYFGRRRVMLIAGCISLCGTFICAVAPSIEWLIFGRIVQGVGFSGVGSTGRAILRDRMGGLELAKYAAYLSMAIALSIDLAPFVGGFLQEWFGWRSTFWLIFIYNLIAMFVAYKFKDTGEVNTGAVNLKSLSSNLMLLLKNKRFLAYNLIGACAYSFFMLYLAVASFIIQVKLGKSPVWFGSMALGLSCIFVIASYVNGKLLSHFAPQKLIIFGLSCITVSAIFLFYASINLNVYTFILGIAPIFMGTTFIMSNCDALAFSTIEEGFGIAAAFFSTVRLVAGVVLTALISLFDSTTTLPLAVFIGVLAGFSFYIMTYLAKLGHPKLSEA